MPLNVEIVPSDFHDRDPCCSSDVLSELESKTVLRSDGTDTTKSIDKDMHDLEDCPLKSTDTLSFPLRSAPDDVCSLPSISSSVLSTTWKWTSLFFVPTISVAYLAFCYVVHYRIVPARLPGLSMDTTQFLTNLGAGMTTVNIITISITLFPLKALLYELQSEEFFRLLSSQHNRDGVKLTAVNSISSSSCSFVESAMLIVHRRCSLSYVVAAVAAIAVWSISILAPAALNTQLVIVDGAIMAFSVGAIPPLALYQPVAAGQTVEASTFSPAPGYSAAIVWAEREIGLSYAFSVMDDAQGRYAGFAVPTPPMLNSTINARWLTDVVGFNPYCTWAKLVNLTTTSLNVTMNSTDVPVDAVSVYLEGVDLRVSVPSAYFPVYTSYFVSSINVHDPTLTVFNYTTGNLPTDGAMVMSVIQCISSNCTKESVNIISMFIDFSDVPSMRFSSVDTDYDVGFLVCKPNITIETREVRTQGSNALEVRSPIEGIPRQGNLDWTQTSLLVSYSLSELSTNSGPESSSWLGLGSGTQADFMFGSEQMNTIPWSNVNYENTTMLLKPLSTDQLAQGYTQMVKASMKPYVSGLLGTSYVPGRVASVRRIFVSSLPHVVASTGLFLLLYLLVIAAHFRPRKGEKFSLTNVAAALADSEFPQEVKKARIAVMTKMESRRNGRVPTAKRRATMGGEDGGVGESVARNLGDWRVSLKHSAIADGLEVLHVVRK